MTSVDKCSGDDCACKLRKVITVHKPTVVVHIKEADSVVPYYLRKPQFPLEAHFTLLEDGTVVRGRRR